MSAVVLCNHTQHGAPTNFIHTPTKVEGCFTHPLSLIHVMRRLTTLVDDDGLWINLDGAGVLLALHSFRILNWWIPLEVVYRRE